MPFTNPTAAEDEILSLIKTVGEDFDNLTFLWEDVGGDPPRPDINPLPSWARVTVSTVSGSQASLANFGGVRRWRRDAVVLIALYTPAGDGKRCSDELSWAFEQLLQGTATENGAWFRDVRTIPVGKDGPWHVVNIVSNVEYDIIS